MSDGISKILNCRRSMVSIFAIACITGLGIYGMSHGLVDVSGLAMAIAGICGALSGANSYEATKNGKTTDGVRTQSEAQQSQSASVSRPSLPKPDSPD